MAGLSPAKAQSSDTQFYFDDRNGGFETAAPSLRTFGAAVITTYSGSYGDLEIPSNSVSLSNGQSETGAAYWKDPIDLSKGFTTQFWLSDSSTPGLALVIKNPSNTTNWYSSTLQNSSDVGDEGVPNALAIEFTNVAPNSARASVWAPVAGRINHAAPSGLLSSAPFSDPNGQPPFFGVFTITYSSSFHLLEVFYRDLLGGTVQRLLNLNLNLDNYAVLQNGKAYVGFTAAATGRFGAQIRTWSFGNNLDSLGAFGSHYSAPMTFKTSKQSVFGPNDRLFWNTGDNLKKSYNQPVNSSSSSNGYSASAQGGFSGAAGIRFTGLVTAGTADVSYPLLLNLMFPDQYSLGAGSSFNIGSSYSTSPTASFMTTSPDADFSAFLTLITHNQLDLSLGFPDPFSSLGFTVPLFGKNGFGTNVDDVEFFDTDFLIKSGLIPFISDGVQETYNLAGKPPADGKISAQNPGVEAKGEGNKGSSHGASSDFDPLDFISLTLSRPALDVSGYVDPTGSSRTQLSGGAKSTIVDINADFTNALLAYIGLEVNPFNANYGVDLGPAGKWGYSLHVADLYGDLTLGVGMAYKFAPMPHLVLLLDDRTDPNDPTTATFHIQVPYNLNAEGSPVNSPPLSMPGSGRPLTVTPTLYFSNPDPNGPAYNQFTATPAVIPGFDLGFNPFSFSVDIGNFVNVAQGLGPYQLTVPANIPLVNPATGQSVVPTFQMGGFSAVTGPSYTLYPRNSPNPVINSASPNRSPDLSGTNITGTTQVVLDCANADFDVIVIWDRDPSKVLTSHRTSSSQVEVQVPNGYLQGRGYHTLTLVNAIGMPTHFYSNAQSFAVTGPVPGLASLSPAGATLLSGAPMDLAGHPIPLIDTTDSRGNVTGQYFVLNVTGSNFVPAVQEPDGTSLPGSTVMWNSQALPTTFISSTQLWAPVPAGNIAALGSFPVEVITGDPGGGASGIINFPVVNPAPVLLTLSEARLHPIQDTTRPYPITVTGQHFVTGSQAYFDSFPITTTYRSSGLLSLDIPGVMLTSGSHSVAVNNPLPGGGTAGPLQLLVITPPAVDSVFSPLQIQEGSTSTLTLTVFNPNPQGTSLSGVSFTVPLPTQMQAAAAPHVTITGGTGAMVMAAAGAGTISVSGLSLAGQASATITVDVTSATVGTWYANPSALTSVESGPGKDGTATSLKVIDASLSATAMTISAVEGNLFSGPIASFTDAAGIDSAADYSATINWGDNTPVDTTSFSITKNPDGSFSAAGKHTYLRPGQFSIGITINDTEGASISTTSAATIADAPLVVKSMTITVPENSSFNGVAAAFTDGNPQAVAGDFQASIDWGDQTALDSGVVGPAQPTGFSISGRHTYSEDGNYDIKIIITDIPGGSTTPFTSKAIVTDPAVLPTGSFTVNAIQGIGSPLQTAATFTDPAGPEALSNYSATLHWGDNSSSPGMITLDTTSKTFTVKGSHTYARDGSYTINIDIAHGTAPGAATTSQANVQVNLPPVAKDDSYTGAENSPLTIPAGSGLLSNDSDTEQETLTAVKASDPGHGVVSIKGDGSFTYTPMIGFTGMDSFTYTAGDPNGTSTPATVHINIPAPISTPAGKFTADGSIAIPGGKAFFNIYGVNSAGNLLGTVWYSDALAHRTIGCKKVTAVTIAGTHARMFGKAVINGATFVDFAIDVNAIDSQHPRATFQIQLSDGYSAGGALVDGKVTLQ